MEGKNRIYDLINLKEWEVKISIVITAVLLFFLYYFDFYNDFHIFESGITDFILCGLGAMFGMLGFALSGVAIIVSLFSKNEVRIIHKINGKSTIDYLLSSYVFLAINVAVQGVILLLLYLALLSDKSILDKKIFWVITCIEVYHIIFIIFYTVALIENCIKMYKIKNIYEEIENKEKNFYSTVNEIKIDFIFSTLINNFGCSLEEIVKNLILFINDSTIENKEKIMKYIENQYKN